MKFDGYTLQARLMPTYVVLLPLAIGLQVWLPEGAILERLGTILVAPAPLAILLAQLGRDRGYRLQKQLWTGWGGAMTTQMLRHRRTDGNPVMRQSYHACIERLFPDLNIPTSEEENATPQAADRVYEAATKKLIAATRDRDRFPLIYKENVSYAFRRARLSARRRIADETMGGQYPGRRRPRHRSRAALRRLRASRCSTRTPPTRNPRTAY